MSDAPYDLFVSYAHKVQDKGWIVHFVETIREIQARFDPAHPWRIFHDYDAIMAMDDWEQKLLQGVRRAGVLVAILSPAYFKSDWCEREWREFRDQEKQRGGLRILPIYFETEPTFENESGRGPWQADLASRQFLDGRTWKWPAEAGLLSQLERLVWAVQIRLSELAGRLRIGVPFQVPRLPEHHIPRLERRARLRDLLLRPGKGGMAVTAIHGLPGSGKSTLAASVALDPAVLARFADGVLWATLGEKPDILPLLESWGEALKVTERATSPERMTEVLRTQADSRDLLLVLDDVWEVEHVKPFEIGGPRGHLLITTRQTIIGDTLKARSEELGVMTSTEALDLFAARLGRGLEPQEEANAAQLARALGHLPLALELAAAQVADGVASWGELLAELKQGGILLLDHADADSISDERLRKQASLSTSILLSLRRLTEQERTCFAWLGILAEDAAISPALCETLWEQGAAAVKKLLHKLRGRSLIQGGGESYRLHDMLAASARGLLTLQEWPGGVDSLPGLGLDGQAAHRALLRKYRTRRKDWSSVKPDGYIHDRLGMHLMQAGLNEELWILLSEQTPQEKNSWFEACEKLGKTAAFLEDVERAWTLADEQGNVGRQCRCALMRASVNSLAGNLPASILGALVDRDLWPVERALVYARWNHDPEQRLRSLLMVRRHLAEETPHSLAAEAAQAAATITHPLLRARTLAVLLPQLPETERPSLITQAWTAALAIDDEEARGEAIETLVPVLPPEMLPLAQQEAMKLDEVVRRGVLNRLAERLSDVPRSDAPQQPFATPQEALTALDERRPIGELLAQTSRLSKAILPQVLARVVSWQSDSKRGQVLQALAPTAPENLLPVIVQAALGVNLPQARTKILDVIAARLPPALLTQVVALLLAIGDEVERKKARTALSDTLTTEPLPNGHDHAALADLATSLRSASDQVRARALGAFVHEALWNPLSLWQTTWPGLLRTLANRPRRNLLSDLVALAPLIHRLGGASGVEAVCQAIDDVGRWWP